MERRSVKNAEDARRIVRERNLSHVKVGVHDVDGILRGKYLHRDKFFSALEGGFGFCDVVLGWDSNDQLYDNVTYTGWHTAYPDANVRILPETCREIATEPGNLLFLCEFTGKAEEICPRATLRRVLARARRMGFEVKVGFEYEFFVFAETAFSIREKGFRNLKPISPGFFGYSMLRNSVLSDWYKELLAMCETMDMGIEGLHTETGAGVLEAALRVRDGLSAADSAALFKLYTKVLAQKRDWLATFMAKWSKDWPGQSGHIHTSLTRKSDGKAAFHDTSKPHNMSDEMRWFVGGQQKLMPELLAMVACTVNSYSRLIPGFWAPTTATWGVENRTCALRVIPGGASSQRVEYRIAAADINPYLALAVAIGSGLHGIENKIEPDAMVEGNAYEKKFLKNRSLPRTLTEASEWLLKSRAGRALFGDDFVEHFAASREWEDREFRRAITDWELARYFEII
jgi:glutamine synthetase